MKKISHLILGLLLFVSTVIASPKKEKCTYIKEFFEELEREAEESKIYNDIKTSFK